ncbi:MAG: methylthioribulose 1-phosphate dehydratase [Rhodanobacter sp.]
MNQASLAASADNTFASCAETVACAARELAALGWAPATSGNFSMRVGNASAAITISGRDKRNVGRDDIMLVDLEGRPVNTSAQPSAETALHTQLYRRFADVNAVLHTHSRTQSVASRLFAIDGAVRLQGWELQKALNGHATHTDVLEIPVFPNTQHMPELVARVAAWLDAGKPLQAYLIDGHGIYTWGRDMPEARRHLEALEFLLGCELDLRRLQRS